MSKYSTEFKLKVVKYYLKNNISYGEVTKLFNIRDKKSVVEWIKKYQEHGVNGLKKQKTSFYNGKFKQNVIEYMNEKHLSHRETAIHFNLGHHSVVSKWENIYYEKGPQALYEERRGRKKNMSSKPRKKKMKKI